MVKHYNKKKFETIDVIQLAVQDMPAFEAFCMANVIKYVERKEYKGQYASDIEKARDYAHMACNGVWPDHKQYDGSNYITYM